MDTNPVDLNLYTKKVEVNNLRPGDILAHDIYLRNGLLVIKGGTELTEKQIMKLQKLRSMVVTLDLTKVYMKATAACRVLMLKAAKGQTVEREEVFEVVDPFIKEANREKNAARLLLQLQSQDEYTFQHTVNIGIIARFIGRWLGYGPTELDEITLAGTLHDIGKSQIPLRILNKPASLTDYEYEVIKKHTRRGYEILKVSGGYSEGVMLAVLQHHERIDGRGYPLGLKGKQIHPYARIVAIADIYHAMTSDRVYKRKVNPLTALDSMRKCLNDLDAEIILVFIEKMLDYYMGCQVLLNDGNIGTIIYIDKNHVARPLIKLKDSGKIIDLKDERKLDIVKIIDV
ncbi:MAG: HD-GYP domain-containing protein [Clostridia bacterium]|nr:HD-GYP domain-containing protein [Clostridia bacterium]